MDLLIYIVGFILFIAVIFYAFSFLRNPSSRSSVSAVDKNFINKEWSEIEAILRKGNVSDLNLAIMNADKLLDFALKSITGKKDCSFADRLKLAKDRFSSYQIYQDVWDAHKIRNRIAHEVNAEILVLESKRALEKFKRGLKDLKAL